MQADHHLTSSSLWKNCIFAITDQKSFRSIGVFCWYRHRRRKWYFNHKHLTSPSTMSMAGGSQNAWQLGVKWVVFRCSDARNQPVFSWRKSARYPFWSAKNPFWNHWIHMDPWASFVGLLRCGPYEVDRRGAREGPGESTWSFEANFWCRMWFRMISP